MNYPEKLIVLPLENNKILLPSLTLRLLIQGKQATELTKAYFKQQSSTLQHDIYLACIPLKRPQYEEAPVSQAPQVPSTSDRHSLTNFGCLARITRVQRSGTSSFHVFLEGLCRFSVDRLTQNTPSMAFADFWTAHVRFHPTSTAVDTAFETLVDRFAETMKQLKVTGMDPLTTMKGSDLADFLMSVLDTTYEERLEMLRTQSLQLRLDLVCGYLRRQLSVLKISGNLNQVDGKLARHQREFYLRQQLEALGKEDERSDEDEMTVLHRRLVSAQLPEHVTRVAQRDLKRLKKMSTSSSEWAVVQNYLDWLAELPWTVSSPVTMDVDRTRQQLDADHFGLSKVKQRIIEYVSVLKMKGDLKAPILCLVGPPGVGKTSLGRSIARSMTREFHRISLGGVRDEAEIRGHRRTYVGAMPGLIIQALHKSQANNPLLLLDEIDKLVQHQGDPAAALLEVLDPEQNATFTDRYLNVSFDLSKVLFIATANSHESIPAPLLDRMELIELEGYTMDEKVDIARRHLVPKQIRQHGLEMDRVRIKEDVIRAVVEGYTRESGVRELERQLGSIVRAKCLQLATKASAAYEPNITHKDLQVILGNVRFEREVKEREACAGVVTGLAYADRGSSSILFIEATKMPGEGRLQLTGSLGSVIQESAQLALSWVKTHAHQLGLTKNPKEKMVEHDDIHVHFPSGSIPKDGPSAGVTLVCALVSLYSDRLIPITTAMTGEISLRGQVLPVGGIKSKVLAAHRAGIRKIILPLKNKQDVEQVPQTVRAQIEFCFVKTIWHVLEAAFEEKHQQQENMIEESHL
ncbi:MAG: ATP-dependent protease La [Benjaminiella poitrasii]|nr:MAG: ATP-dependent protease La [Benjaminiella poitrasii]